jgi:phosphoribosylformylglycinamidine synthase
MHTVLNIIDNRIAKSAQDCSKGGLAVAVSELCMTYQIGCIVSLDKVPNKKLAIDRILFSESHSRYLLIIEKKNLKESESILKENDVSFKRIGQFGGDDILFTSKTKPIIDLRVDKAQKTWLNSLRDLVLDGKGGQ